MCVEITRLRNMWAKAQANKSHNFKVKRLLTLIVPAVTFADNLGCLNNDHWAYRVPYAFRDALDIKYMKTSKGMAWTQGCFLNFLTGDLFESSIGKPALQVLSATPMAWNKEQGAMYEGSVTYWHFHERGSAMTLSQLYFLGLLITGGANDNTS